MSKPKINRALFFSICLICFIIELLYAESSLVVTANNSKGNWSKGIITNRKIIFTDNPLKTSEINIQVPRPGKYQLFAYIYHNWKKAIPCIYVEAVDSEGKIHKGYHKVENIWYLDKELLGRWFFISLAQNPYWELPSGRLNIRFWAEAKGAPWQEASVPMENKIAIDNFSLMPVLDIGQESLLPWIISPELGKGNWRTFDYHPAYATNLIGAKRKKASFSFQVNIPISGHYRLLISVLSNSNSSLGVYIRNKLDNKNIKINLCDNSTWQLISTDALYLHKGIYSLIFKTLSSNEIMIDFLVIMPEIENSK